MNSEGYKVNFIFYNIIQLESPASRRLSFIYPGNNDFDNALLISSKKDLELKKFIVNNAIHGIEESVLKREEQRDYKMKSNE
jgi:hypothetical protein